MSFKTKGETKQNRKQNVKEKSFEGCTRSWPADVMSYISVHIFYLVE